MIYFDHMHCVFKNGFKSTEPLHKNKEINSKVHKSKVVNTKLLPALMKADLKPS